ncbi:hypothetical protein DY000_02013508 [Brassica cretica]|uniref:DUF223 domain-containing protein n=1 Tax=Brassica cretica TaxID=69181 RepID=A0ABQ7CNY0_BRACR|nr:hypothetical protein DY000_02013508 [Brassica cretica]
MAMKPHGKSIVSSDNDEKVVFFRDLSLGPHEAQLRFWLIHFWEAWNPLKKTLIGMEMLLIDEQGTIIQGFISPGCIEKYMPEMKRGSVYKLNNFYGSRNKSVFRVDDHTVTVSFSWNSELTVLLDCPTHFDADSFRFHSYEEFQANCDLKGDLYDVVGHMKLVNGQSIVEAPVLDEVEIAKARRVLIHVQSHDGPVMKLYLWDQAARDFCKKFKSYSGLDLNVLFACVYGLRCPTYHRLLQLLGSNPDIAEQVNAEVVTKRETMTIREIFSYIEQESAKMTSCMVLLGTTLPEVGAILRFSFFHNRYLSKMSVYDNSEQAVFVLLGEAGRELTGKPASELVRSYFEEGLARYNGNLLKEKEKKKTREEEREQMDLQEEKRVIAERIERVQCIYDYLKLH